jgi:hypothetical protein
LLRLLRFTWFFYLTFTLSGCATRSVAGLAAFLVCGLRLRVLAVCRIYAFARTVVRSTGWTLRLLYYGELRVWFGCGFPATAVHLYRYHRCRLPFAAAALPRGLGSLRFVTFTFTLQLPLSLPALRILVADVYGSFVCVCSLFLPFTTAAVVAPLHTACRS